MAPVDLAIITGQQSPIQRRRSHSISSDRPSLTGYGLLSPPSTVSPDPAFIAASAASQIVTNDHDSQADAWFDQHGIEPSGETALVAPSALKLINRFLDQLLFNFLSVSRSTSLASLRPAVAEVLKPKLAKDAINGADQELHEYLGGGEEEELLAFHNGLEPSGDWDLELVWKRTRLRCMVYSSLGDMEEEDEDYYTEQEQLDGPPGSSNRFSNNPGVVSPAVAIFLTSILEFMGEQVLVVAGQAAYHKLRARHEKEERDDTSTPADIAERVVVEENDMEKVALDRTLGRLWRGWKKRIRSPTTSVSLGRAFSRESLRSQTYTSRAASMTAEDPIDEDARRPSLAAVLAEHEHAATIPLPMNDNDIREIEIPGLAPQSDDEEEEQREEERIVLPPRPKSMIIHHVPYGLLTPNSSQPQTPVFLSTKGRKRSNSVPSPAPSIYTSPKPVKPTTETPPEEGQAEKSPVEGEVKNEETDESTAIVEGDEKAVSRKSSKQGEPKGIAEIAGATAIGAAAVTGITAVAHGQTPQTDAPLEETETEDEFAEEVEILTSSRVSLPPAGRVSPEDNDPKAPSRRSSVRSTSVHSLRLIDVGASRSPGMSRSGSVDAADYIGGRPGSIHSPIEGLQMTPRIASPVSRAPTASPIARNGSAMSVKHTRNSLGDSISEVEERGSDSESSPVGGPTDLATAMAGVDFEPSPPPTSQQFASDSLNRDNTKSSATSAPFVLSAAPPSRLQKEIGKSSSTDPQTHHFTNSTTTSSQSTSHSRSIENGVPPLTPLHESSEAGQDTENGNAMGYQYKDYEDSLRPNFHGVSSRRLPYVNRGNQDPWAVKEAQEKAFEEARLAKAEEERAQAAARLYRAEQAAKANQQKMADGSKPDRHLHTSGSGSSSTSSRLKVVRTSEEGSQKENKGQSFEQLIRSDQTIQYTLTPQNMRDIESPDSPRYSTPTTFPNEARPPSGVSHSTSGTKYNSLSSNPTSDGPKSVKSPFKSTLRPSASTSSRQRQNAPQPREARVERDSMGDFAEFIRSTGPTNASRASASTEGTITRSTSVAHRGMNGTARNTSETYSTRTTTNSLLGRSESTRVPVGQSGRVKMRLQARDATVARGDSISDLIDFVRSGPQLDKNSHRIPRTVAPFRTTMDSDQMSGAIGGKAIDASLTDARYSQATMSVEGSITSQSALLKTNVNKPSSAQESNMFEEEDRMPKRKTRRVRDPYAIDLSDEDEDYAAASQPVKEESLADFLRSVPPPPEPVTTTDNIPRPTSSKTSKSIKKKSSTPSLMSRFGRNSSSGNVSQMKSAEVPPPLPKAPLHTPIAAKYSTTYGQTPSNGDSTYVRQVDNARGKVVQKRFEPREASYREAPRTQDLADFLMRSPPPNDSAIQPRTFAPTLQKEEKGSFQRMFGRKKSIHN